MSDKDHELNDDEYAALLRDLEGRASSGGGGGEKAPAADAGDGGDEDLEAFLASLEDDAESRATAKVKTATAERAEDPFAAEFEKLAKESDLVLADEPEDAGAAKGKDGKEKLSWKERREQKRQEKEAARAEAAAAKEAERQAAQDAKAAEKQAKAEAKMKAEGGRSFGQRAARGVGRVALWYGPAMIFWWVLGAFLAAWISAGWLIAAVVTMFVFGIPAILKKLVQRGAYRHWVLGISILGVAGLVAPMPNLAGETLSHYGYWPSAAVAEVSGQPVDSGLVRAHAGVSEFVGGLLTSGEVEWQARRLGTDLPLGTSAPAVDMPAGDAPAGDIPAGDAPAGETPGGEDPGAP
ncbi:hypothetical protein FRC98_11705 [Lujinxingia vulgaris]|uniref:Uncharacterized protein n=1 Tax=Lujinxingia vulgaris TaxID=2600176 RepID=A0A5C6XH17_9DELT|nr:hypothetical protein [Lujinxingia vulgaris]TXD36498.1 hypothetical protein FRC98_11705 [Lujinxingia vulgaris]